MPNNSNARREKDKKRKDKEKKTFPPPLHKEDKPSNKDEASMDSKSLSSFFSLAGSKGKTDSAEDAETKDASPLLLQLGTVKRGLLLRR
jgi:hypothetical protein